jgi:hypothetical protein
MGYKGKIEKLHENKGNNPTRKDLVASIGDFNEDFIPANQIIQQSNIFYFIIYVI